MLPGAEDYKVTFLCGCGLTLAPTKKGTLPKHYIPRGPFNRRGKRYVCPRSYTLPDKHSQLTGTQVT
jgi:hypothetical protein